MNQGLGCCKICSMKIDGAGWALKWSDFVTVKCSLNIVFKYWKYCVEIQSVYDYSNIEYYSYSSCSISNLWLLWLIM
mgnify:CR=1 FL=1